MTPEAIAALVSAITSVIAIGFAAYSFRVQTRLANTTLGVTMLREYERDFFYSEKILRIRCKTALFLLTRQPGEVAPAEAFDLLDFFDSIGFHLNRGIIDKEMAWTYFHYWVSHYWLALVDDAASFRKAQGGVDYHGNCAKLYEALTEFGMRHKGVPPVDPSTDRLRLEAFFREEIEACSVSSKEATPI